MTEIPAHRAHRGGFRWGGVDIQRDKPQLPGENDLARLRANPAIAAFLDSG